MLACVWYLTVTGVLLTTVTGVFIRAVLTVVIAVTDPALGDAVACVTLETAGLARVMAHCGSTENSMLNMRNAKQRLVTLFFELVA